MHLPSDIEKPIVLVGPGTGVAPMRAKIELDLRAFGHAAMGGMYVHNNLRLFTRQDVS
jgi:hypothetical protein